MNDGSTPGSTAEYARIYEEQQPRLVAYARSLTRNAWVAEDLVAEAHFRVWRRLSAGHEIDNVPAYLMTTVRHLAIAAGSAARETPRDPQTDERAEADAHRDDPAEQVSSVDLLMRVLGQLPERWVKALWLAEAEGQPLAAIGPQLGTKQGATAVLLHRAREGMRQAYLSTQTGVPDDPACQVHCARMPAYVRGAATARQSERLLGHVDACDDCRQRLTVLMRANNRLPALVGPALLVFALGGAGRFLLSFTAGSAGAVTGATWTGGHGGGLLHGARHAATGGAKTPLAVAAGAAVAGTVAICLALGSADASPEAPQRVPVAQAPVAEVPVDRAPVAQPRKDGAGTEEPGTGRADAEQIRTDAGTAVSPGTPTTPVTPEPASGAGGRGTTVEDVTRRPADEAPESDGPDPQAPGTHPKPTAPSDTPGTHTPGSGTDHPKTDDPATGTPTEPPAQAPDPETPTPPKEDAPAPSEPNPEDPGDPGEPEGDCWDGHGRTHDVPHGRTHESPHGRTHEAPHGRTHESPHGRTHEAPHGRTPRTPSGRA
ncbi:sigma-70 family RNA polymerase sigma factor [Streptomyces sp. NEAU-NA10]|uniref:sigma-70 family RNA polymerase sigma factor n=1 Tax=Streptomyces sp. NEAU-NA10 TaxID=3416050 RepID=UPI003CC52636